MYMSAIRKPVYTSTGLEKEYYKVKDQIVFFLSLFDMTTLDLIAALKVEIPGISKRRFRTAIQKLEKLLAG